MTIDETTQLPATGTQESASAPLAHRAEPLTCVATTRAGKPCPTRPLTGRTRCRMHEAMVDPELAVIVARDRGIGGSVITRQLGMELQPDLGSPEGIKAVLEATVAAVAAGSIPSSVAQSISSLASTALRLAELQVQAQVAKLEADVREVRRSR